MMTKKDFIQLADELRPLFNHNQLTGEVIDALVSFMKRQNYNFKEERWRDYLAGECGPNGGKL